jgi:hypothetical protein
LRLVPHNLAATLDQRDRAGETFVVSSLLDGGGDAVEALGGETDGFRFRDSDVLREGEGGGDDKSQCGKGLFAIHVIVVYF